jgi:hypothetical protein
VWEGKIREKEHAANGPEIDESEKEDGEGKYFHEINDVGKGRFDKCQ